MIRTTCKLNPVQMAIQAAGGAKSSPRASLRLSLDRRWSFGYITARSRLVESPKCRGSREYRSIFLLPCSKRSRDGGLRQHSLLLASAT